MKITMSATRAKYPLSPKKPLKKTIAYTGLLSFILLVPGFIGMIILLINGKLSGAVVLFIGMLAYLLLIVLPTYMYQKWYYAVYFYEIDENYVRIRKGPLTPKEITIPFEKVQDVYVDQDLLDRVFGLYDVHLSSATMSSGSAAHIDGLAQPAANELKELLLATVTQKMRHHQTTAQAPTSGTV